MHVKYHTQKTQIENKIEATKATSHRKVSLTTEPQRQDWIIISFTVVPSILNIVFVVQVVILWLLNNKNAKKFYLGLSIYTGLIF